MGACGPGVVIVRVVSSSSSGWLFHLRRYSCWWGRAGVVVAVAIFIMVAAGGGRWRCRRWGLVAIVAETDADDCHCQGQTQRMISPEE